MTAYASIVENRSAPVYDIVRSAAQIQHRIERDLARSAEVVECSPPAPLPRDVLFISNCLTGGGRSFKSGMLYAMVKVNLHPMSFVEENESAALSADYVQILLDHAKGDVAEERQLFGTAHARLASGVPARMGSKVRSLARQAIALRSAREKNPEDPERWAERITKSIYGE